jgi:hypothetical protein
MKVNKIFDLTDNDDPNFQTQIERENNQQLVYDETDAGVDTLMGQEKGTF